MIDMIVPASRHAWCLPISSFSCGCMRDLAEVGNRCGVFLRSSLPWRLRTSALVL